MSLLRCALLLVVAMIAAVGLSAAQAAVVPSVVSTSPVTGATGIATDAQVSATFSAPMNAATITASTFTLTAEGASAPVVATVAYNATTSTATLTPGAPLAKGTTYTATLATTIADTASTAFAAPYSWRFTTIAPPPVVVSLSVTSTSPAANANAVALGAAVSAVFPTAMNPATITSSSFMLIAQGATTPVAATVTYDATSTTAKLVPTAPLAAGTTYTAALTAMTASPTAAPLIATKWTFTTAVAPAVTTAVPAAAGTGIATSAQVRATFSAAMDAATLTADSFTLTARGAAARVVATVAYDAATSTAILTPAAVLAAGTTYTVGLAGTVGSAAGIALAPRSWDFTTSAGGLPAPGTPTPPPAVTPSPADGATGVATNTRVQATFGAAMNAATITASSFTLTAAGSTIPVSATVGYDSVGNRVTLTPTAALAVSTTYTAKFDATVKAADGVAVGPKSWSFTTAAVATAAAPAAPIVTSLFPADGQLYLPQSTTVSATFDVAMDPRTITTASFTLVQRGTTTPIAATVTYTDATKTAVLTPASKLLKDTWYVASLDTTIASAAGTRLAATRTWSFMADSPPPAPVGITGIALDGKVELAWQPVTGAVPAVDGYSVYRGTTPTTVTTLVTPAGFNATSFTDATAANGTKYYYVVRARALSVESVDSLVVEATPAARSCSTGNPVVLENCSPGSNGWKPIGVDTVAGGGIAGFATATSVNRGGSVDIKVDGAAGGTYSMQVYRIGYYNGAGGRLFSTVQGIAGKAQPACATDAGTGLYDCANWSTSVTLTTTASWPSGVYLLHLIRDTATRSDTQVLLTVRDDASTSGVLYGVPFSTYQAYNNYGGKSLYTFNSSGANTVAGTPRAVKVSFDRPFAQVLDRSLRDWFTRADYQWVYWLEREGYDVSYISNTDLETRGIGTHKAYVMGAHDEYWSQTMRAALENGRAAAVSLLVSGANAVYWKIRFENGTGGTNRVEVGYKNIESSAAGADPVAQTTTWRDSTPRPPLAAVDNPENALLGQMYAGDNASSAFPLVVGAAEGNDPVYRNTGLDSQPAGTSTSIGLGIVGWEWDARFGNGREPANVKTLATSPVKGSLIQGNGSNTVPGSTSSNVTKYVAASGATVFATGTNDWGRGLGVDGDDVGEPNQKIQQITTNVLFDMGAPPATPAAAIVVTGPTTPRPAAPTGLATTTQALDRIGLTWSAVGGADGYYVYRSQVPRSGGEPLGTLLNAVPVTATSYTDTLLDSATVYYYVVTSVKGGLQSTASNELEVATTGATAGTTRINAGGAAYTSGLNTWLADTDFAFGGTHATTASISGTTDQALFQDERFGTFAYAIPVVNGTYSIRFRMAETFFAAPCTGRRVFSLDVVDTAGPPDVANLDVCNAVGANAAFTKTITNVSITDGIVDVKAIRGAADDPLVSALEVIPSTAPGAGTAGDTPAGSLPPPSPPTVIGQTPAPGAVGVAVGVSPTATFSRAMNAATITNSTFTVTPTGSTTPVAATASYNSTTNVATLTPAAPLAAGVTYDARVAGTVADASGTQLGTAVSWSFTTAGPVSPPTVVGQTPAPGAVGVAVGVSPSATFSRAMNAATITNSTFTVTPTGSTTSVAATVSYNSTTNVATLTPVAPLVDAVTYDVRIAATVADASGTQLGTAVSWSFTTVSSTCPCSLFPSTLLPELGGVSTANGRAGGPWSLELGVKIQVDVPMRLTAVRFYKDPQETGTHTVTVWTVTGIALATVPFSAANEVGSGWVQQPLLVPLALEPNTTYVVSIGINASYARTLNGLGASVRSGPLHTIADGLNGMFSETAGTFPNQSFSSTNYFVDVQVSADAPGASPTVTSTTPAADAGDVSRVNPVSATLSRALDPLSVDTTTFTLRSPAGTVVPASVAYDSATRSVKLTPSQTLDPATTFTARLTTGVRAADGTALAAPVSWRFTTRNDAPMIVARTPASGATGVSTAIAPTVTFSETMIASTINATTVTLSLFSGAAVPAAVTYDAVTRTATLTPAAPLTEGSVYTMRVDGSIQSAVGTPLGAPVSWTFTAAGCPCTLFPPTLQPDVQRLSTVNADGAGSTSLELAVKITVDSPTRLSAIRYFRDPAETGSHIGRIWTAGGRPLASVAFANEAPGGGWKEQALPNPLLLQANTVYVISTNANTSWGRTLVALEGRINSGPLHSVADGRNGAFASAAGTFPTQSFSATNYFVDAVILNDGTPAAALSTAVSPANDAVAVSRTTAVSATFNRPLNPSSVTAQTVTLAAAGAPAVSAAVTYDDLTRTVTLTPAAPLEPATLYTASLSTAVETADHVPLVSPVAWRFATDAAPPVVTGRTPVDGALGVPVAVTPSATFSTPMAAATLTASTFTLTKSGDASPVAASIALDAAGKTATLTPTQPLAGGATYTARIDGSVKSIDNVVLGTAVTWSFQTVDTTPPDTAITSGPSNPTKLASATFAFTSTKANSTFACSLDAAAFTACSSGILYAGPLADGSHTFQVRATDLAGNTDPTPAGFTWTVDTTAPDTIITASIASPTTATSASFSFTSDEPAGTTGTTYACSLDGAVFSACTSPQPYVALALGSHTFSVRATDAAGNVDATPASVTWLIGTTPTVTAKSPADSATGVPTGPGPKGQPIKATFSRAMDATTITSSSYTLTSQAGLAVAATVTYDSATTTATLTPNAVLANDTLYTARLEATIKAADGLPLAAAVSWTFRTALPPVIVTFASTNTRSIVEGTDAATQYTYAFAIANAATVTNVVPRCASASQTPALGALVPGSLTFTNTGGSFKCTFVTTDGGGPTTPATIAKVSATVTRGADGRSETSTQNVTIKNANPVATITSPPAGSFFTRGSSVAFTSSFTDPGGTFDKNYTCTIDWGDNTAKTVLTVAAPGDCNSGHVYLATSTKITLTVTDKDGGTTTVSRAITVV